MYQQVPRGDERARVHKSTGMQHPTVWISAAGVAVPGCLTVWPSLTSPRDHLPASEIQSAGNTGEPHRPPHHMDGRFLPLIYRTSRATLASPPQPSVRLRAWASKIRKQPAPNSPSTRRRPLPVHTRLHELACARLSVPRTWDLVTIFPTYAAGVSLTHLTTGCAGSIPAAPSAWFLVDGPNLPRRGSGELGTACLDALLAGWWWSSGFDALTPSMSRGPHPSPTTPAEQDPILGHRGE